MYHKASTAPAAAAAYESGLRNAQFATAWTLVDNHFVDELERFDILQNQLLSVIGPRRDAVELRRRVEGFNEVIRHDNLPRSQNIPKVRACQARLQCKPRQETLQVVGLTFLMHVHVFMLAFMFMWCRACSESCALHASSSFRRGGQLPAPKLPSARRATSRPGIALHQCLQQMKK